MSISNSNGLGLGTRRRQRTGLGSISVQPRGGVTFLPGCIVVRRIGSLLAEIPLAASPRTDLIVLGYWNPVGPGAYVSSSTSVDSNGGEIDADGNKTSITISPLSASGTEDFATAASGANQITSSMVDQPAFVYDDDTYYATDNSGTLSFGGWVVDVDNVSGRVVIKNSEQLRQLYELYSAGQATPGYTSDDSVSYAMTNLPAGTFADGVWTATATGAISTTQDGLTVAPAAGDKVMFPPGTLTTLVVSAANSGPYECITPGATGVKAVYKRTARFAHGAIITPGTRVRVTLGGATTFSGTVWRCDPTTAAKVVGTDDPVMFPERVIVQKTCSSGAATIATVPLRAAGKFSVTCDYNGGTPAATTTSIQASTQTPGALGTASIVIQEQSVLGTLVNTGTATCAVTVLQ
ncbi:MAG: hypothetical protein ACM3O6_10010 [Acidobacteriota bacterium]